MANKIVRLELAVVKIEEYKETTTRSNYVAWGEKNDYPTKLVKLFNECSKHGAIVTGKASYICGSGIETTPKGEEFLKKANPREDVPSFLKKLALDYELFGGYAYLVVPNMTKERAAAYYHIDLSKLRTNEKADYFWYYPEWEKVGTGAPKKEKGLREYPAFDGTFTQESIVYYTQYRPSIGTYPQPEYRQGLTAIETDARVNNFHLNNLRNGFFSSKIISVRGQYSTEQQDDFEASVKQKFASDENAGEFMIVFNDGDSKAVEVEDLSAGDFGEQFAQLRKDTEQEIFIAHKIPSPMLFGVRVEGQLGGRTELLEAWELFDKTYIQEKRAHFEVVLSDIASMKGVNEPFEIIGFKPLQNMASESIMLEVLTKDEIRQDLGKEPLDTSVSKSAVNDAINSLSPLVANKVLESMTPNEIRGLAALQPKEEGQDIPTDAAKFAMRSEVDDVAVFAKYGFSKEGVNRLSYSQVKYRSIDDMNTFHTTFASLDNDLSAEEKKILEKISAGKNVTVGEKVLKELKEKKLVETDREDGSLKLTQLGGLLLTNLQPEKKLSTLKTVYEYVKRPDASGPDILPDGRTRPFCEELIRSNKYFSKEDIESISTEVGYDVWTHRGGWITLPSGNHRPSCRHIWQAVLIEQR